MADHTIREIEKRTGDTAPGYFDVVIIGAGPAGLAAGLTTAHRGLTTLIIEAKDQPGGQPSFLYPNKRIIDIPGFPDGITGEELSARVYQQALAARAQFRFQEELVAIEETDQKEKDDTLKRVVTHRDAYLCRKVILAMGLLHMPRRLAVLERLRSSRVHYKNPPITNYEGRKVAIVGGGDSAMDAAIMAIERGAQVTVLVRERNPFCKATTLSRARESGAEIRTDTEVHDADLPGDHIQLKLTTGEELLFDLVIVQIGFLSAQDTLKHLQLRLNEDGSIAIDPYYETSRRGIFAVGDVHGDIKLIVVAWAEGIQAAIYAFKELTSPHWLHERRLTDYKLSLIGEKIASAASQGSSMPVSPKS